MNLHKTALLILLAACARPAYSGSASTAGASVAPAATTAAPAARTASSAPSAGASMVIQRPAAPPAPARLGNSSRTVPVLVIPAKEMDTATYGRVVEDLSVMNRIIEKSLRDLSDEAYGLPTTAPRIELFLPSDRPGTWILRPRDGRPRAIYVGGYGAVFSLQVDFPLVPPPQTSEPNKTAEKGDQVWAAAQRELANPSAPLAVRPGVPQGKLYRPEAVENLRSTLIALLKHATNIRDLEPESWLTILVQGPGTVQPEGFPPNQEGVSILGAYTTGTSLLTLRAKKADIDQFAQGRLDQTQFQQRVPIVTR